MSKYNDKPKDKLLDSSNSPKNQLLENSMHIYASESSADRVALESIIRYSDLDMLEYAAENQKIDAVIKASIERNIPLTESHQKFLVDMSKLVKTRITQVNDPSYQNRKSMIVSLENDLSYPVDIKYVSESVNPYGDSMTQNLVQIANEDVLTARGLYECCDILVSPLNPMSDSMKNDLKNGLKDKLCNTLRYECNTSKCSDFPLIQAMGYTKDALKDTYADKNIGDLIDNLFEELSDSIDEIFENYLYKFANENGFNPDPFNIYNLTPLPVGARTINRNMTDLINAQTDEQITEALVNMGRINHVLEFFDTEEQLTEAFKKTKAFTRNLADKSNQAASKLSGVTKDAGEVGDNVKRIGDPFVRYIDSVKNKAKQADKEERRNMIIKGGVTNKVFRYMHRYILAIAVGTAVGGPFLGAIATAITFIGSFAVDKELDKREKNKILKELEDELTLVEEKIEDCRGDEDKQKKYELMRIRNNLKREIDRINLGLKY